MTGKTYPLIEEEPLTYSFISKGKHGAITKIIRYDKIFDNIYNLGFGDQLKDTNHIDDKIVTDNGDTRLVLATVIRTLPLFFEKHPDAQVYFTGSDQKRINLYNYLMSKRVHELEEEYLILGQKGDEFEIYDSKESYSGFVIKKLNR